MNAQKGLAQREKLFSGNLLQLTLPGSLAQPGLVQADIVPESTYLQSSHAPWLATVRFGLYLLPLCH